MNSTAYQVDSVLFAPPPPPHCSCLCIKGLLGLDDHKEPNRDCFIETILIYTVFHAHVYVDINFPLLGEHLYTEHFIGSPDCSGLSVCMYVCMYFMLNLMPVKHV